MKRLPPLVCALCLAAPAGLFAGNPFQIPKRSVSASGEFVIYCDDTPMRMAVSTFCEDAKSGIMTLLGQNELADKDRWKIPIVIKLLRPDPALPDMPLYHIQPANVEGGGRTIELDVTLRGNLAEIHFQQKVVETILLEMEYRDKGELKPPIIYPPEWLVEGLCAYLRSRDTDVDVDVYKTLLANSDLPTLGDFLGQTTLGMNEASLKLYQAYSFSFLQLLAGLQGGPNGITQYIHDLPLGQDTPSTDLMKHFPALGGSPVSLEKWWTLSMAGLAASDRYKGMGLSLDETEQQLTALLKFKIPVDKSGKTKDYTIGDFKDFVKNPQAQPVLAGANSSLQYLATQANPLYRPIVAEYVLIVQELQDGRTRQVGEQLKEVEKYQGLVLKRMSDIADYMNWFEATQIAKRSNSFDDYLQSVKEFSNQTSKRNDAISRYLDSLEIEMQ